MDFPPERDLFQLTFVSSATRLLSNQELADLLVTCRRNNERRGITGLLLYHEGNFLEVIEGARETIEWLYRERLLKDSRHRNVICLLRGPTIRRSFPDWSMGFRKTAEATHPETLPGFNDLLEECRAPDTFFPDLSVQLRTFLRSFYRSSGLMNTLWSSV